MRKSKFDTLLETILNNASIALHKQRVYHDITTRSEALMFCRWNIQEAYRHYKDILNISNDTLYFMNKFDLGLGDVIPRRVVWVNGKPDDE